MDNKKNGIEIKHSSLILAAYFPSHVDEDSDVEEEGGEDKEDGGEEPDGQRGQTFEKFSKIWFSQPAQSNLLSPTIISNNINIRISIR